MRCSNCRAAVHDDGIDCFEFLRVIDTDGNSLVKQSKTARSFCDTDCRDDYYWPSRALLDSKTSLMYTQK